jgi:hypothetical protein
VKDPATWHDMFPGDSSAEAYRAALQPLTPLSWEIIEESEGDLLRLLIGKVPGSLGATVLFGLTVLFRGHPKADQASVALLATVINEVEPGHARTLLIALSDGWLTASNRPIDSRPEVVSEEFSRALRRLRLPGIPDAERNALDFLQSVLDGIPAG